MTSDIEKEFFKVFGIEPISKWHKCKDYNCVCCDEYDNCSKREFVYTEITDRILLELICILGTTIRQFKIPPKLNIEQLKYHILRNCINEQESIYTRVKSLFKGEEQCR